MIQILQLMKTRALVSPLQIGHWKFHYQEMSIGNNQEVSSDSQLVIYVENCEEAKRLVQCIMLVY